MSKPKSRSALYIWLVTLTVLSLMPVQAFMPTLSFKDIIAHFILYMITGALFLVEIADRGPRLLRKHPALWAAGLAAIFGLLMEVAQGLMTTYRTFSYTDAIANALGAIMGVSLLMLKIRSAVKGRKGGRQDG